jgi:hypothetical protein
MTTAPKDSQQLPQIPNTMNSLGPPNVVVSLMTGTLLVTLAGARTLSEVLTQIGLASEELLRGERLPTLQSGAHQTHSVDMPDVD